MAAKYEIIDNALVITDTVTGNILLDRPANEIYYISDELDNGNIILFDRNAVNIDSGIVFKDLLTNAIDSTSNPFTEATFRAFSRTSLGFNTAPGGSGAGFTIPDSATVPFIDIAARNTWAAANLGDLIKDSTAVLVAGTPSQWYLWTGETDPPSHDANLWNDVTPLVKGEEGPAGTSAPAEWVFVETEDQLVTAITSATALVPITAVVLKPITLTTKTLVLNGSSSVVGWGYNDISRAISLTDGGSYTITGNHSIRFFVKVTGTGASIDTFTFATAGDVPGLFFKELGNAITIDNNVVVEYEKKARGFDFNNLASGSAVRRYWDNTFNSGIPDNWVFVNDQIDFKEALENTGVDFIILGTQITLQTETVNLSGDKTVLGWGTASSTEGVLFLQNGGSYTFQNGHIIQVFCEIIGDNNNASDTFSFLGDATIYARAIGFINNLVIGGDIELRYEKQLALTGISTSGNGAVLNEYWDNTSTIASNNVHFVSDFAQFKTAVESDNGTDNVIILTEKITVSGFHTLSLTRSSVILDTGFDVGFEMAPVATITFSVTGTPRLNFLCPIILSSSSGNICNFTGTAFIYSRSIFGGSRINLTGAISLWYEYADEDVNIVVTGTSFGTQEYWNNTNKYPGFPDNYFFVNSSSQFKSACENTKHTTKVIIPNATIFLTGISIESRGHNIVQDQGIFDNKITFDTGTTTVNAASGTDIIEFLSRVDLSFTGSDTVVLTGTGNIYARTIHGNCNFSLPGALDLTYEYISPGIAISDTGSGTVSKTFWHNTNRSTGGGGNVDYTQFFSTGQIAQWDQTDGRLEPSSLKEVAGEIECDKDIQVANGKGFMIESKGKIHATTSNDLLYTDTSNESHSLLHSLSDYVLITSNTPLTIAPQNNEYYKYTNNNITAWQLPAIDFGGLTSTTVKEGFNFKIHNEGGVISLSVNSGTVNTFQDGTTTTRHLPSGTLSYLFIKDDKWALEIITIGQASLNNVSDTQIPIKINGIFEDSGIRRLANGNLMAPSGFSVEQASINFGDFIVLSESSGYLSVLNMDNNTQTMLIGSEYNVTDGSLRPKFFDVAAGEGETVIQGENDTEITATQTATLITTPFAGQVNSFFLEAFGDCTNVRIRFTHMPSTVTFKYLPSRSAWDSGTGGYDFTGAGLKEISLRDISNNFMSQVRLLGNQNFILEIVGDVINLKGNSFDEPYLKVKGNSAVFTELAYDLRHVPVSASQGIHSAEPNTVLSVGLDGLDAIVEMPQNAKARDIVALNQMNLIGSNTLTFRDVANGFVYQKPDGTQLADTEVIVRESTRIRFEWGGASWRFFSKL